MARGAEKAQVGRELCFAAIFCAGLGGCEPRPVGARAVWLDAVRHADASRTVHVYDRGAQRELEITGIPEGQPYIPMLLSPTGGSLFVRGRADVAMHVDLENSRVIGMRVPDTAPAEPDPVEFSRGGDALLWSGGDALSVVPLALEVALPRDGDDLVQGLRMDGIRPVWVGSAASAPILYVYDDRSRPGVASMVASRYPDSADPGGAAPVIRELGRIEFSTDDPATPSPWRKADRCIDDPGACGGTWAITPSGDELVYQGDDRRADPQACGWWRWSWRETVRPECLHLPQAWGDVSLLAALHRNAYVFSAGERLYLWHREQRAQAAIVVKRSKAYSVRTANQGARVLLVGSEGPTVSVSVARIEHMSTTVTRCAGTPDPVVSPQGDWVVWSCVAEPNEDITLAQSAIIRVSGAGLERFGGIPMEPLAVDDDGDALLYSYSQADGFGDFQDQGFFQQRDPKTLYVLGTDSVLDRVHDLEPSPESVLLPSTLESRFIQAASLRSSL
ncbi:MAG: hypothetical protein V3V08_19940 [Nannocystaceae bacterium]